MSSLFLHAHMCYGRDHSVCFNKAVIKNDLKAVKSLIEAGLQLNKNDAEHNFLESIKRNHFDLAKYIRSSYNIDVTESLYERKYNALHSAIQWANDRHKLLDMVEYLIGAGVPVIEMHPKPYTTSAMEAVRRGVEELLKLFLDRGSNIHFKDMNGMTSLHYALMHRGDDLCSRLVELLIEAGVMKNCVAYPCYLRFAIMHGNSSWGVMKKLIDAGAELNTVDENNVSVLVLAVWKGDYFLTKNLISSGANLNITQRWSNSALEIALRTCRKDIVELLLKCGASVTVQDKNSFSIINIVLKCIEKKQEYLDILNLIIKYGAADGSECKKYYMKSFLMPDQQHPIMMKWNHLKQALMEFFPST
ncbi:hypothetical protein QAD02_016849 [Eretmocerus hayati]|uniref:Uncharacterized protein n=1 Tax=Eretmocerus hayati TaxID=131215 RepID=A0ACC2PCA7_9HYME|nr:hypothetical protein QAD02_016849 [Eretmocerus hayati]